MHARRMNVIGMRIVRDIKRSPGVSKGLVATGLVMAIVGGIMLAQKRKTVGHQKGLQPA